MICKDCSVINTPNLLHAHTNMVEGVSMEQIWCVYHTIVFTVDDLPLNYRTGSYTLPILCSYPFSG